MTGLGRFVGVVQWLVGVATATAVVMLFTLGGAGTASTASDAEADTDPATLEYGAQVYTERCAVCHGDAGEGGTGPRLAGAVVAAYPDPADQLSVVAVGRNAMPGFGDRLSEADLDAVVAYTREALGSAPVSGPDPAVEADGDS